MSAILLLSACTSRYSGLPQNDINERYAAFTKGQAVLDCQINCSGAWGFERRTLLALMAHERWQELAWKILEIGYSDDLAWYYLGRAAEGLTYQRPALIYYYKSISGVHRCDGVINNCDGFKFPADAQSRIDALSKGGLP